MGPTVQVMPGPNKSFEAFQADQAACKQYADQETAAARKDANNTAVGTAFIGTAVGAAVGASAGNAGAGAAGGSVLGTVAAGAGAQDAATTIQQRYDIAYEQCMYSKGDQVPGYETVAAPAPPPIAPPQPPKPKYDPALVSAIQTELARIGLYGGAPDGAYGPRTRGAIADFEKTKGLPVEGIPSQAVLAQLKQS
jgi:hypothetical protein